MDMFFLLMIVLVVSGWVKAFARSRERYYEMRLMYPYPQAAPPVYVPADVDKRKMNSRETRTALAQHDARMAALVQEISQLRDTTTQYCVSLQHSLDRLEQRVEFLERRRTDSDYEVTADSDGRSRPAPPIEATVVPQPAIQSVGLGQVGFGQSYSAAIDPGRQAVGRFG